MVVSTPNYNIADHYWVVAGGTTQVYSSKAGAYVPTSNAAYVAWLNLGNLASKIDTEKNLGDTLAASINLLTTTLSTALVIQQALRQKELDIVLVSNADNVTMVKGGQSTTVTGSGLSNFLAQSTNNYRTMRAQIAAATTAAQVQAINVNAGWPNNP